MEKNFSNIKYYITLMEEVLTDIFLIKEKGAWGAFKPTQNIYILAGNDGLIYDAGYGDKRKVRYLINQINKIKTLFKEENRKFNLSRLLISHAHPDHFSGAIKLRKYLGIKIILTEKTARKLSDIKYFSQNFETSNEKVLKKKKSWFKRFKSYFLTKFGHFFFKRVYGLTLIKNPDIVIPENCEILINGEKWKIFPSPGHSSDHISLYNEKKGVLFSGDNVLSSITTWLGPPDSNLEDYVNSVKEISNLPNLKLILGAHGSIIKDPRQRLNKILKHRKDRTKQIKELVMKNNRNGITSTAITKELYPGESRMKHRMAKGYIVLTLQYLEKNQKIYSKIDKKNKIKYFPIKG